MDIIPEIGKLYQFREDNRKAILKKYNSYYTGLLLCIQADVTEDLKDSNIPNSLVARLKKNPIYGFETYNCIQHYSNTVAIQRGIKVADVLYLTYYEVNDMLEPARAD